MACLVYNSALLGAIVVVLLNGSIRPRLRPTKDRRDIVLYNEECKREGNTENLYYYVRVDALSNCPSPNAANAYPIIRLNREL